MDNGLKYRFLLSQISHIRDIQKTEKTELSVVFYELIRGDCILRVCKDRDLSALCQVLRQLRDPNLAVVYDYAYENGNTYILEENLAGRTLEQYLQGKGTLSERETARLMIPVCKGLELLHRQVPPVVHNDINPSNIMLCEDGGIKLFDFDISRLHKKGSSQNTMLLGTEEYAAPEHFGYGQSEPRTDVYCVGVTMHKMLTGKGLSPEHKMDYAGGLKGVLGKCLAFDPQDRYASAAALRRRLEGYLSSKKRLLWWALPVAAVLLAGIFLLAKGEAPAAEPEKSTQTEPVESIQHQPQETVLPQGVLQPGTLQPGVEDSYLFTIRQEGLYVVTVENTQVDCQILYSGQRNGGSVFSGWTKPGESTQRSFRAQAGDTVYIQVRAQDADCGGDYKIIVQLQ